MSYVQIRYSGIAISDGNELQGLTLGGTGSGTVLDHIQSHNSADDGIEIFGGTSNLKYIAITGADDDGFDIDNGYRGFMQFLIAAQRTLGATADSFSTEIDSNNAEELLPLPSVAMPTSPSSRPRWRPPRSVCVAVPT